MDSEKIDDCIFEHFRSQKIISLYPVGPVNDALEEMKRDVPIIYKAMRLEYEGELKQLMNEHRRRVRRGMEFIERRAK